MTLHKAQQLSIALACLFHVGHSRMSEQIHFGSSSKVFQSHAGQGWLIQGKIILEANLDSNP